jgi:hypothetical protein
LKAEIQTRSILQHAWAEIEHDLGYKSTQEVPQTIRRRFSRLAGLLELADQEFISIKNELSTYESSVPERIEAAPQLVTIDKASLLAFISNSELVSSLDMKIASFCGARINFGEELIPNHLRRLRYFGIETISELEINLKEQGELLLKFAEIWLSGKKHEEMNAGISLFYLGYVLIAQSGDANRIDNYLSKVRVGVGEKNTLIQRILTTYRTLRENSQNNN